MAYTSNPTNRG